jgi:hypothetical protein
MKFPVKTDEVIALEAAISGWELFYQGRYAYFSSNRSIGPKNELFNESKQNVAAVKTSKRYSRPSQKSVASAPPPVEFQSTVVNISLLRPAARPTTIAGHTSDNPILFKKIITKKPEFIHNNFTEQRLKERLIESINIISQTNKPQKQTPSKLAERTQPQKASPNKQNKIKTKLAKQSKASKTADFSNYNSNSKLNNNSNSTYKSAPSKASVECKPFSTNAESLDSLYRTRSRANYQDAVKLTAEEKTYLNQAIQHKQAHIPATSSKSVKPSSSSDLSDLQSIPDCRVYYPSHSQFADPIAYINEIRHEAELHGMCKVVPPAGWSPPFQLTNPEFRFKTRLQRIHSLQDAAGFDIHEREYSMKQFEMSSRLKKNEFVRANFPSNGVSAPEPSITEMERKYWEIVTKRSPQLEVQYGNDIDSSQAGSGFELVEVINDEVVSSDRNYAGGLGWNLRVLPLLRNSLLGYLDSHVPGVSTPWVYIGQLFSTFCWHNEDDYLYSINYHHIGAPKSWYAVPGKFAAQFEKTMKNTFPELFELEPDLLHKLITMISPTHLQSNGVKVYHAVQKAGEFIVTFPKAYHSGFSHGFNCGEAVNFATENWFPFGREASKHYRQYARFCVFSHQQLLIKYAKVQLEENEAVSVNTLRILLKEMKLMKKDEEIARNTVKVKELKSARCQLSDEDYPHCSVCNHYCYLSYIECVGCDKCQGTVTCLQHKEYACQCNHISVKEKLAFVHRYSIEQLQEIILNLANRLEKETVANKQTNLSQSSSNNNLSGNTKDIATKDEMKENVKSSFVDEMRAQPAPAHESPSKKLKLDDDKSHHNSIVTVNETMDITV